MAIKNYVSNYFWSTLVDSIDVSIAAYPVWFRCTIHECNESIYLELLVLVRKIYNNDDITFFSVY